MTACGYLIMSDFEEYKRLIIEHDIGISDLSMGLIQLEFGNVSEIRN